MGWLDSLLLQLDMRRGYGLVPPRIRIRHGSVLQQHACALRIGFWLRAIHYNCATTLLVLRFRSCPQLPNRGVRYTYDA